MPIGKIDVYGGPWSPNNNQIIHLHLDVYFAFYFHLDTHFYSHYNSHIY